MRQLLFLMGLIMSLFLLGAFLRKPELPPYDPPEGAYPVLIISEEEAAPGPELARVLLHRISAYNPVPRQTQGDPGVSSCGPNLPRQIAVSRDLFFDEHGRKHLCGQRVAVLTDRGELYDDYVIWDTMAPRFTQTADIMLPHTNESEAYAFGITTGTLYFYD